MRIRLGSSVMYRWFDLDGIDEFSGKFDKCGMNLFFLSKLDSGSEKYGLYVICAYWMFKVGYMVYMPCS
jgi:hypothetical protein